MVKLQNSNRRWDVLAKWALEFGWTRGVELGVLDGRTHLHLLSSCPDLSMVGIDIWEPKPEKDQIDGGRSFLNHNLALYQKNLMEHAAKYGSRSILIKIDTVEAALLFEDGFFDFVFIDADHTTEAVLADIEAWKPKIKAGGYLCGHDTHFPSVREAIDEVVPMWSQEIDHVWWVQC